MGEKEIKEIEEVLKQHLEIISDKIRRQLDILMETILIMSKKLDRIITGYRISESRD